MAILVTGGAGYIGSVTVEHLRSRGEKVVVLDNLSRGHRQALGADITFYQGEVGNRALVAQIAREHEIESCIHFASLAYVGESVQEPELYFENNLAQGLALFGALLHARICRMVFSSSCVTYGEQENVPIREEARQWPTNPYGWSKLLLERALVSYDATHRLKFVALRYFNAAGATESHGEHHVPETHLIPNVLQAASGVRARSLHLRGQLWDARRHGDPRLHPRERSGRSPCVRAGISPARGSFGVPQSGKRAGLLRLGSDRMRPPGYGKGDSRRGWASPAW